MCVPVIGAIAGLVGSVISGAAAASAAEQQAENHKAEQRLQNRQAVIETQTGEYEATRTADTVRRTAGAQRAGFAANGIGLDGSAAEVMDDTAREGALDIAAVRWNSKLASDNLKYSAKISAMNAEGASRSAGAAFLAPVLGGISGFAKTMTMQSSFAKM